MLARVCIEPSLLRGKTTLVRLHASSFVELQVKLLCTNACAVSRRARLRATHAVVRYCTA